ncbi:MULTISPECIES: hypothetical protein [unclassified Sphingopyxis]|uniref:hypothetical protein n=1 Tax=unclassified Sphingopyxis TaxID=2614943 RepID=UPI00285AEEBF|nr:MULTISPECIES: hypothetical protein [unclassified Sphingopyxis]MDR6832210.1 hypothetical protein [Sphingopyxis sp. BE122]MDR7227953.1 hypothetical protein [Sphingopyxis sp. BE259]
MTISLPPPHDRADGDCDCLPPRPDRAHDAGRHREPRSEPGAEPESRPDVEPDAAAGPPLTTYVLRYQDAWFGLEKRVAFEAPDIAAALAMMAREPIGAWAELLHDGIMVCRRGHEPGGAPDYWVVD